MMDPNVGSIRLEPAAPSAGGVGFRWTTRSVSPAYCGGVVASAALTSPIKAVAWSSFRTICAFVMDPPGWAWSGQSAWPQYASAPGPAASCLEPDHRHNQRLARPGQWRLHRRDSLSRL